MGKAKTSTGQEPVFAQIKEEFLQELIAFGGGGARILGERSPEEINDLAIIAQSSRNPELLKLFDGQLPALDVLRKQKTDSQLPTLIQPGNDGGNDTSSEDDLN